jgi:hypothetical protein
MSHVYMDHTCALLCGCCLTVILTHIVVIIHTRLALAFLCVGLLHKPKPHTTLCASDLFPNPSRISLQSDSDWSENNLDLNPHRFCVDQRHARRGSTRTGKMTLNCRGQYTWLSTVNLKNLPPDVFKPASQRLVVSLATHTQRPDPRLLASA